MALELVGFLGILVMFILMFLRIPIAMAMALPAFLGILYLNDWNVLQASIESIVWEKSAMYLLSSIPMFVLMGELLSVSQMSDELFSTFRHWFGRIKGGLGIATVGASAIFAAASGSSIATTGTIGVVASREMQKAGYDDSLAGGSIVAGGTLGILIPPSTMFILYGMLSEQSIGKLLLAGIIPGILLTLLFSLTVYISVLINPKLAPLAEGSTWKDRFISLRSTGWIILLFIIVIGGMYVGWFNPTEAAAIGAVGAAIIALIKKKLTWNIFIHSMNNTFRSCGFIFAILLAAYFFNYFMTVTRVPNAMAEFLVSSSLSPTMIFFLIILMYIILGAIMDTLAMIVVTMPVILPIVSNLGFDLIWFGVILVIVVEMALISPPVGMNCFVLKGVVPKYRLEDLFKGAVRFMIPIAVLIVILYLFPEIALFLPNMMMTSG